MNSEYRDIIIQQWNGENYPLKAEYILSDDSIKIFRYNENNEPEYLCKLLKPEYLGYITNW